MHEGRGNEDEARTYSALSTSRSSAKEPTSRDVLLGRGGAVNEYCGNILFRRLVEERKDAYNSACQ